MVRLELPDLLKCSPHGERVKRILEAALQAADPATAVQRFLQRQGERLYVADRTYDLSTFRRVLLLGVGKASVAMARAAAKILGDRLSAGLVIVKEGYESPAWGDLEEAALEEKVAILTAAHPIPDRRGLQAAQRLSQVLQSAADEDLLVCLLSGGGSALLTLPLEGLSLEDLQALTALLLASGATIHEINCVRKHLERLKGGRLAQLAARAHLVSLILSDVVGDPLEVIASGPTTPDPTTFDDAWAVLERYGLLEQAPRRVIQVLKSGRSGKIPETPKPGEAFFERVQNVIVANNYLAAQAALRQAQVEGFHSLLLTTFLQGEARQAGRFLAAVARQITTYGQPLPRPACLVAGGETTVTLQGDGRGGRNQELALAAVQDLEGLPDIALVTLATDGGDGPTEAAGAAVSGETMARARAMGLHPQNFLKRNDSYHFFKHLGDLLITGPTGTNVNDLALVLAF